jgi:hypothetical protein
MILPTVWGVTMVHRSVMALNQWGIGYAGIHSQQQVSRGLPRSVSISHKTPTVLAFDSSSEPFCLCWLSQNLWEISLA